MLAKKNSRHLDTGLGGFFGPKRLAGRAADLAWPGHKPARSVLSAQQEGLCGAQQDRADGVDPRTKPLLLGRQNRPGRFVTRPGQVCCSANQPLRTKKTA
jgi:hypothetical protein